MHTHGNNERQIRCKHIQHVSESRAGFTWKPVCCTICTLSKKHKHLTLSEVQQITENLVWLCGMCTTRVSVHVCERQKETCGYVSNSCIKYYMPSREDYSEKVMVTVRPIMDTDTWKAIHSRKLDLEGNVNILYGGSMTDRGWGVSTEIQGSSPP